MNIRKIILQNTLLREIFFFIRHKKVNLSRINKRIKKLTLGKYDTIDGLVISLTTYGSRLSELKYTLYSLINQSIKPEKIVVNLTDIDYQRIPLELKDLEKFNVCFVETEDLKSYKKLIPTIKNFPNYIIVTADDDLFYPRNWLKDLWEEHLKNPNCIICKLTKTITMTDDKLDSYNKMKYNKKAQGASYRNFILSGGGTLFPPDTLYKDIAKEELYQSLCPYADDIWDWFMAILNGTKIIQTKKPYVNVCYVNPYREYGINEGQTLSQINVDQNKNDEQFRNVMNHYGLSDVDLKKLLER